ncbi:hypothetical protein EV426DRAFT_151422 [Tirmania nivea]|nr:hypothetical protein EV426DRAFT_151422 [Tirmania nivea]
MQTDRRHFRASEITEIIFRKYFARIKMQGNFDDSFFDSINEVFICLVTSAMRHCLKAWSTGVYVELPKKAEFKYQSSASKYCIYYPIQRGQILTHLETYKWFLATWEAYSTRVRKLLLAAIKADIRSRLAATEPSVDQESDEPLHISDSAHYEQELTEELANVTKASRLARCQISDSFLL